MVWFVEDKRTWMQKVCANVLKNGPVPKHVAIIMDGNRRYARVNKLKQIDGHVSGFNKLAEALNWCFTMDIREVTVYAFSIENFKRSKAEVDDLFNLAREKFKKLFDEKESIDKHRICIRIFGDLSLVPKDLQEIMAEVMNMSKDNDRVFLNVCFAYTAREEMTMACRDICEGVKNGDLEISDIDEALIDKCLYTSHSYDVDLMVRTSGEVRLSDFLLWQSAESAITFVDTLWPEFSIWNFYLAILNYQMNYKYIQEIKGFINDKNHTAIIGRIKKNLANENEVLNKHKVEQKLTEREHRINSFLQKLYSERQSEIDAMAC